MKCPYCGQENSDTYKFCRHCGQKRPDTPGTQQGSATPAAPTQKAEQPQEQWSTATSGGSLSAPPILPTMHAAPDDYTQQTPFQEQPVPSTVRVDLEAVRTAMPGQYSGAPLPAATPVSKRIRRPGLVIGALVASVMLVILAVAAAIILLKPETFRSAVILLHGKNMVIGLLQADGAANLYLLEEGQAVDEGTLLAEAVEEANGYFYVSNRSQPNTLLSKDYQNFAGFIPGSKHLFFWHLAGDEIVLEHFLIGDSSPGKILNTQADSLSGIISDKGNMFLGIRSDQAGSLCYASLESETAKQLGEGNECLASRDGSTTLILNTEDGKLSLKAMTVTDNEEVELLNGEEGAIDARLSGDGALVAYVDTSDNRHQVVLLDAKTGDELERSEQVDKIISLEFAPRGDNLYFIADDNNGEQQLFVLNQDGSKQVATAKTIQAQFSQGQRSGEYLIYLSAAAALEEGDQPTLFSYKVSDETDEKTLSAEGLNYTLLESPERILFKEETGTEITLHSAPVSGKDQLTLFQADGDQLAYIQHVPGENKIFLLLSKPDNLNSLYVTSLDKEDGYFLLKDYSQIKLLSQSLDGKKLAFLGRKGQEDIFGVYVVDLDKDGKDDDEQSADPVLLDDNLLDAYNAIFSTNNKELYYTVKTGENASDVQVRRAAADGEGSPADEYQNAFLADAQWSAVEPFETLAWEEEITVSEAISCSSAGKIPVDLGVGNEVQDILVSGQMNCYSFQPSSEAAIHKVYSIAVDSMVTMDPVLRVIAADGTVLGENDDSGPGRDPLLTVTPTLTSTLTIEVWAKEQQGGDYQIRLSEGTPDLDFANATILPLGERLRGAITPDSAFTLSSPNLENDTPTYGQIYAITGKAGETIKIEVFARSVGSQLTPQVQVFDPNQSLLKEDDIIVTGNQDYAYLYTLKSDGRFYIFVKDNQNRYGSEDKFFFEIAWNIASP
jgi:hypothetical protein